jgi:hypothetical protein
VRDRLSSGALELKAATAGPRSIGMGRMSGGAAVLAALRARRAASQARIGAS